MNFKNSDMIMFTDSEELQEIESRNMNFIARAVSFIKNRRKPKFIKRLKRDHYGAHDRLVDAYFTEKPL